jgi:hypothetical protein
MITILFKTNNSDDVHKLSAILDKMNDDHKGKEVEHIIEIKQNRPIRSVKANRYYRIVLQAIATASGDTDDALHEYYKKRFNGKQVIDEGVGQSTSDMDSAEFSNYVNRVKKHGEDFFNVTFVEPADKNYSIWEQITKNKYNEMFSAT